VVFAAIARSDGADETSAVRSFASALERAGLPPEELSIRRPTIDQVDQALGGLRQTSPASRKRLMAGCAEAAFGDGEVTPDEEALMRAVGEALDCPVPIARSA
jgi:tellurite resistance protein